MMKKLFSFMAVLIGVIMIASNCWSLVETATGPSHTTLCYMVGTGPITSGDVVILQTSSPTYWGAEVTGTSTAGLPIYGVVNDSRNRTSEEMALGKRVRVQIFGYCPILRITHCAVTVNTVNAVLVTSRQRFAASTAVEIKLVDIVSSNTIALESKTSGSGGSGISGELGKTTIKAWLDW